jgi:hypothetical protein
MTANLKLGVSENPTGELPHDAKLQTALAGARSKLEARARSECEQLKSNLGLILRDFTDQHGISAINWVSPLDRLAPCDVLDMLAARLCLELTEKMYARFLERFTTELVELDAAERRSQ